MTTSTPTALQLPSSTSLFGRGCRATGCVNTAPDMSKERATRRSDTCLHSSVGSTHKHALIMQKIEAHSYMCTLKSWTSQNYKHISGLVHLKYGSFLGVWLEIPLMNTSLNQYKVDKRTVSLNKWMFDYSGCIKEHLNNYSLIQFSRQVKNKHRKCFHCCRRILVMTGILQIMSRLVSRIELIVLKMINKNSDLIYNACLWLFRTSSTSECPESFPAVFPLCFYQAKCF